MPEQSRRFRIESGDRPEEYRIVEGAVEVRSLALNGAFDEYSDTGWWRLTPQQLSTHVERNTAVAQWLERRLGWRRLLRACVGEELFVRPTECESRNSLRG